MLLASLGSSHHFVQDSRAVVEIRRGCTMSSCRRVDCEDRPLTLGLTSITESASLILYASPHVQCIEEDTRPGVEADTQNLQPKQARPA